MTPEEIQTILIAQEKARRAMLPSTLRFLCYIDYKRMIADMMPSAKPWTFAEYCGIRDYMEK